MAGKSKLKRIRKYVVPEYLKNVLKVMEPPEDISVSEWAEQYRILEARSSSTPGPWGNDKTPYLKGVMDSILDYQIEETVFVKPTQTGGTEAILNIIGWTIHEDPVPTMVVYPSKELGESIKKNRIDPMIKACPELAKRFHPEESSLTEMQFDGMSLAIVGSNSPSQLASRPIGRLFLDEMDKYPGASKEEADPVSLAQERTKTYRNRKIFKTSTPTLKTGHIWRAMEACDEIRHYFVPCPHCGKFIELKFANIRFPDRDGMTYADRAEFAVYVCQECSGIIQDRHKPEMLRLGEWRAVSQTSKTPRKVAFWINTLYSPFVRFAEIAKEFLLSKDDPDRLQNFTNSWLAEPWEDTKLRTNADLVMDRQTDLPEFTVPEWAKILTAGVDVQEASVYYVIRAWGNYLTSQVITRGQVYNFSELEKVMNLSYQRESDGASFVVSLALVDSGDNTDLVYDFCANNQEWAMPSKGASHSMDTHFRLSKVNRTDSKAYGMTLVLIDTGKYKDMIAGRMRKENGTGSWMVFQGVGLDYAEQVTAEHKVNVKSGKRTVQSWVLKNSHADNHYLDCEVYAFCAADMLGIRTMHLQELEGIGRTEPQPANEYTPEEDWIRAGNWLGG